MGLKNYETNRLESGLLQLSDKTHLVIDETMLEPGQLNDRGVRNCRALGSVISNQRLEYDFQFYPVEFNTDIPVLILSEGKSMLPRALPYRAPTGGAAGVEWVGVMKRASIPVSQSVALSSLCLRISN
ncbi:hypothetical protein J6590_064453 [Homalodisca vitripennis]|nr:hypothetical protein J6590_064453 [Homalodisca vitripennis]